MHTTLTYNSILLSITSLLDYTEMDILENVTNHGRRVAYISLRIGKLLGFSREDLFDLGSLALLHDVGATQSISNQTLATIKRDDLEKFRDHCIFGQKILDNTSRFSNRKNIILYHHEKLNGSGYPKGLRSDSLDYESRALAALDIYQALTENRPYRPGYSQKEAMGILTQMVENNELDRDICIQINQIFQLS